MNLARAHVVGETSDELLVEMRPTSLVGASTHHTRFVAKAKPGDGSTVVTAATVDYGVYQEKLLFLIPVGPKTAPGSKAYDRRLDAIKNAL